MEKLCLERSSLEREVADLYPQPVSTFGANLKRLRRDRGLSAKAVAEAIGVKQGTYSDWERDRRGLPEGPTLLRFGKFFSCSMDELVAGIDKAYDKTLQAQQSIARKTLSDSELFPNGTAAGDGTMFVSQREQAPLARTESPEGNHSAESPDDPSRPHEPTNTADNDQEVAAIVSHLKMRERLLDAIDLVAGVAEVLRTGDPPRAPRQDQAKRSTSNPRVSRKHAGRRGGR
jgi:transcriptional regulator with XRE-family HTH domain